MVLVNREELADVTGSGRRRVERLSRNIRPVIPGSDWDKLYLQLSQGSDHSFGQYPSSKGESDSVFKP